MVRDKGSLIGYKTSAPNIYKVYNNLAIQLLGERKILLMNSLYQNYQQQNIPYYQQSQSNMRQQAQPQMAYQSPYLKGRLVSSLEEARAAGIDFDGSIFYFPDLANRRIYTKQINLDGTATLNMYELKEIPMAMDAANTEAYITREEFEQAINKLRADLQQPKITF